MAQNDMEVIMYKILKYLYECMKTGKIADLAEYGWESKLFHISKAYWISIIYELVSMGFIRGFLIHKTKDGTIISEHEPVSITYVGREFLRENSGMQKAKDFAGEAFEVMLSSVLGIVM